MKTIKKVILLGVLMLSLSACAISENESQKRQNDKDEAMQIARTYINDKYGIDAEVMDSYIVTTHKPKHMSAIYEGNIIVEMKRDDKIFYVWINKESNICKDNYQEDEIKKDIHELIQSNAKGTIKDIKFKLRDTETFELPNKDVDEIIKKAIFYDDIYDKKNIHNYIASGMLYVYTVGTDLDSLYTNIIEDISWQTGAFVMVMDFLNDEAYEMIKNDIHESDNDLEEYSVLLNESIMFFGNSDETMPMKEAYHTTYTQEKVNRLQVAYANEEGVAPIQVEPDEIKDRIKEHTKDISNVLEVYQLSGADMNISYSLQLDGWVSSIDSIKIAVCTLDVENEMHIEYEDMDNGVIYEEKGKRFTNFYSSIYLNDEDKANYIILFE